MFRKFLFSMVVVFVRSPYLQGYVGVFIVLGATICLCVYKPYSEDKVFKLELFLLVVAAVTLLAPQMGRTLELDTNLGTRYQQNTLGAIHVFITWFLVVLNLFAVGVFLAYYYTLVRKEFRLKRIIAAAGGGSEVRPQGLCDGEVKREDGGEEQGGNSGPDPEAATGELRTGAEPAPRPLDGAARAAPSDRGSGRRGSAEQPAPRAAAEESALPAGDAAALAPAADPRSPSGLTAAHRQGRAEQQRLWAERAECRQLKEQRLKRSLEQRLLNAATATTDAGRAAGDECPDRGGHGRNGTAVGGLETEEAAQVRPPPLLDYALLAGFVHFFHRP